MSNQRQGAGLRVAILLVALLAACGGDSGNVETTAPAAVTESTESDSADAEPEQTTTTAAGNDGSDLPAETFATLEIGGATYEFGLSEGASCDPERLSGSFFEAQLSRVDDSGEPIGDEGIWIVLPLTDQGDRTVSVGVDGGSWTAGEGTGGGFPDDTHTVDGNRAEATLTFVNPTGDEAEGRVEVLCAGG